MTAILHATELAHFASTAAFVGLAVTLILGCFIIRFAPARRRAIADRRRHQTECCRHRCPSENGAFVEELMLRDTNAHSPSFFGTRCIHLLPRAIAANGKAPLGTVEFEPNQPRRKRDAV